MTDARPPVVAARGLTKVFTDFWGRPKAAAVNGVEFTVPQGEVLGFLGPNGSGKSTTVKMLLGLLYPTAGELTVFGAAPSDVASKKRIGYLPEETFLYKYLTALETLEFFGSLFQLPPDVCRQRARQLLDQVGLAHAANRPVGEFSKGMARRIGLAQALINDPDLIILDEPTAGLDPIGCQEVKEIINLLAHRGKTIILCSHLLADVEDVCHTVLIMYGGKIRARGPLRDLLTRQDRTRIMTPELTPELTAKVMKVLDDALPPGSVAVDKPSMSLENFFLEVVRQARGDSVATAGAQAEGKIAEFLTGGKTGNELLQALAVRPEAELVPAAAEPAPDLKKLAALTQPDATPAPPPAPTANTPAPPTAEELARRNQKLKDLLNKQD